MVVFCYWFVTRLLVRRAFYSNLQIVICNTSHFASTIFALYKINYHDISKAIYCFILVSLFIIIVCLRTIVTFHYVELDNHNLIIRFAFWNKKVIPYSEIQKVRFFNVRGGYHMFIYIFILLKNGKEIRSCVTYLLKKKDFEQIAINLRDKGIDANSTVNCRKDISITPR